MGVEPPTHLDTFSAHFNKNKKPVSYGSLIAYIPGENLTLRFHLANKFVAIKVGLKTVELIKSLRPLRHDFIF